MHVCHFLCTVNPNFIVTFGESRRPKGFHSIAGHTDSSFSKTVIYSCARHQRA